MNCSEETKEQYTKLLMNNKNIAHFTLSIPRKSLSNYKFRTTEREKIAQQIIDICKLRVNAKYPIFEGITSVPFFEINYGSIKYLQNGGVEGQNINDLNIWAQLIQDIFGFKEQKQKQQKKNTVEMEEGGIEKEEKRSSLKVFKLEKKSELLEGSKLMTESLLEKLRLNFPGSLSTLSTERIYSTFEDGVSYKT